MTPDVAYVALSLCPHLGGKTFFSLLSAFGFDLERILRAETDDLRRVPGIGPKIAQSIRAVDLPDVERRMKHWQAQGIALLTPDNPRYPIRLRALDDAPPVLFLRGEVPSTLKTVAIVGTRTPTVDGKTATAQLAMRVIEQGGVVVSGLAVGIDREAHLGALALPGGHTVAVLGNGNLRPYPPENVSLAEAILERGGGLLCEVAPDAGVSAAGLVARNRLITGMSSAVVVVQTEQDGGAMHAARFAKAQGRPLYTFDLPATGNRALIDDGATVLAIGDSVSSLRFIGDFWL